MRLSSEISKQLVREATINFQKANPVIPRIRKAFAGSPRSSNRQDLMPAESSSPRDRIATRFHVCCKPSTSNARLQVNKRGNPRESLTSRLFFPFRLARRAASATPRIIFYSCITEITRLRLSNEVDIPGLSQSSMYGSRRSPIHHGADS